MQEESAGEEVIAPLKEKEKRGVDEDGRRGRARERGGQGGQSGHAAGFWNPSSVFQISAEGDYQTECPRFESSRVFSSRRSEASQQVVDIYPVELTAARFDSDRGQSEANRIIYLLPDRSLNRQQARNEYTRSETSK
jgi:hypothetical protein